MAGEQWTPADFRKQIEEVIVGTIPWDEYLRYALCLFSCVDSLTPTYHSAKQRKRLWTSSTIEFLDIIGGEL